MWDYKIIAIDFDGTIFETEYPKILRPILPVIEMAKTRKAAGDKLILWTCREGPELEAAVEACREHGLEFDAVNDNLPEAKAEWGNNPRKVAADVYWDDKNRCFDVPLGTPLVNIIKLMQEMLGEMGDVLE